MTNYSVSCIFSYPSNHHMILKKQKKVLFYEKSTKNQPAQKKNTYIRHVFNKLFYVYPEHKNKSMNRTI